MLGFSPKLPVNQEERLWVDEGFVRLEAMLSRERLLEAKVVLPDAEHFPDAFDGNEASVETLIHRVCEYMRIDPTAYQAGNLSDEADELRENSLWSIQTNRPAGIYFGHESVMEEDGRVVIALKSSVLKDPIVLVATVAHELGHLILLGDGHIDGSTPDHEPMTDLLTVFLGLGHICCELGGSIPAPRSWRRMAQLVDAASRLPVAGSLWIRACEVRGRARRKKAGLDAHLSTNVRAYFKRSLAWLAKNKS